MTKAKVPTQVRRLTLVIDADVLAYEAAAGEQQVYEWGEGVVGVRPGTLDEALVHIQHKLDEWMTHFKASHYALCLTDEDNFRKRLYPPYKASRVVKPVLLPEVRKYMLEKLAAYKRKGLEGDDVIGILTTHPKLIKGPKLMISVDKDMLQIPGTLYRPHKNEVVTISREESIYWHYYQTMVGDPTDEYPGIRGIGDVKARRLLENDPAEWWPRMVALGREKGMDEDALLVQARVAKILQHTDYNYHTKEPILWTPPSACGSKTDPTAYRSSTR